jgi:hypothetical protein
MVKVTDLLVSAEFIAAMGISKYLFPLQRLP